MVRRRHRLRETLGSRRDLAHVVLCLLILLPQLLEEIVFKYLRGCVAFIWIVNEHLGYDVLRIGGDMGDEFLDPNELLRLKVEFHVCSVLLEVVEQFLPRRAHYVMDLIDLVELVVSWE